MAAQRTGRASGVARRDARALVGLIAGHARRLERSDRSTSSAGLAEAAARESSCA